MSNLFVVVLAIVAGLLASNIISKAIPEAKKLDPSLVLDAERFYERNERSEVDKSQQREEVEKRKRAKRGLLDPDSSFMTILEAIGRLVPVTAETRERDRDWLSYSGVKMASQVFWALRVLCTAAGVVAGVYFVATGGYEGGQAIAVFFLCVIIGSQLPTLYVFMRRSQWRREMDRQLPDALDLMVVCISAGTSLDTALRVVSERMQGALPEAFADIVEESRYGSRSRALSDFAARTGVESMQIFAASMAQAEATGSSLLTILREQADGVRIMRRLTLEQRANALQVKILFPMLLFVFPLLVILVLAPMIPQVIAGFSGL